MSKYKKYRCEKCGHHNKDHSIASPDEVLGLRSLGYEVFDCDELDPDPFLGEGYRWVWVMKEGLIADSLEIEEVCKKNVVPDDPCDSAFMEDISS